MNYKIEIQKVLSNGIKGYWITVNFFQDTKSKSGATYTVHVKTKKEAKEWERKNKEWLLRTAKNFTGV